eukprot:GEZU01029681.1.p1 GENE.GEZU01029681.1~~GEZU01029681.1.p1  ORF type:complete len:525 (-),score=223.16 GEZU01029681.1:240-1814(-)
MTNNNDNNTSLDIESVVLRELDARGEIADSGAFAKEQGVDHQTLVGTLKSLESDNLIATSTQESKVWSLTAEGQKVLSDNQSPEIQIFNMIPKEGILKSVLDAKADPVAAKAGFAQCVQNKWIRIEKIKEEKKEEAPVEEGGKKEKKKEDSMIYRVVDNVEDSVLKQLKFVQSGDLAGLSDKELDVLKRRKLVAQSSVKTFKIKKGANFSVTRKKAETDITFEMLQTGAWKDATFKPYNFNALGKPPTTGHLHPLLKVRSQFRSIFLEMGFEEMPTNNYVESSFWNFDALFQPQQHPARDMHDTFFLNAPATTLSIPSDYLQRVKDVHEKGGYESIGYRYEWKEEEARKNLLRTHTTAVSSRMLYKLAQGDFTPKKYFSIDRVFRNEEMDATHLCEFHQIEGMIIDYNLSLGDLIGVLTAFFAKIGITNLKFKPAYNPYTEPSMEIFGYHPQLKKLIEIGNSGVFRPEMLRPMGLPENVSVLAWGLSLERPTMIMYGIDNIKSLVGHKVDLEMIKNNPICRLGD